MKSSMLRTAAAKKLPTEFTYTIDMDERGEFRATVYGPGEKEVLEVNDETFEDGFMKNKNDLKGLAEYLEDLGIGGKNTRVKKASQAKRSYFTVKIPPAKPGKETEWHHESKTLTRGDFKTKAEGDQWAKKNLKGNPYSVVEIKEASLNPSSIGKKTPPAQMDPNSPYLKDFNQRRWSELSTLYNKGLVAEDAMLETKLAKLAKARQELRPALVPILRAARKNRIASVEAYLAVSCQYPKVSVPRWNNLTSFEKHALLKRVAHLPQMAPMGLDKDTVRQGRGFMTYNIDKTTNKSKFYEGLIVQGSYGFKVIVRWGALTDSGDAARIEGEQFDKDPRFSSESLEGAKRILTKVYKTRLAHGYKDAYGPDHVSPVDGKKLPMGQYPVGLTRQVGFGWGTQSITQCVPALRQLTDQLNSALKATASQEAVADIKVKLEAANTVLNTLARTDSTMATKLKTAIGKILRRIEGGPRFLPDPDSSKLMKELKSIITYVTKQTSYCG